jgi:hypothetical protein
VWRVRQVEREFRNSSRAKSIPKSIAFSVIDVCKNINNNQSDLSRFNPLNAELNPICHLLALLGAHHILHVSRIRVKA